MAARANIESKLSSLRIDLPDSKLSTKKEKIAESWEDEDLEDDANAQTPTDASNTTLKLVRSSDPALAPPPPTPVSAGTSGQYVDWSSAQVLGGGRPSTRPFSPESDTDRDGRRPEKTTATASRMIAAGLGVKAPKKTEEQRQYDRSVREQEIKRKNREKEERERERQADEQAKVAVWES